MKNTQSGIFSLGTASHAYLEWDLAQGRQARDLVSAIASLHEPRMTTGGINLVCGFRPELWRGVTPEDAPADLHGFNEPIIGVEGFAMPATQHDAVIWLSGSAYDLLFDVTHALMGELDDLASLADETTSWPYRHNRDLTGFEDGTENPSLAEAQNVVGIPQDRPGAGGSVLLLQKWIHNSAAWEALSVHDQEQAMGRTKPDSVELDDKPETSHVARTDQDTFGHVFRRNTPFGTTSRHGTMFVGFCAEQRPLAAMLESMAGVTNGVRDALTRYTHPLTGAYYFIPSTERLREFGVPAEAP